MPSRKGKNKYNNVFTISYYGFAVNVPSSEYSPPFTEAVPFLSHPFVVLYVILGVVQLAFNVYVAEIPYSVATALSIVHTPEVIVIPGVYVGCSVRQSLHQRR